MMSCLRCCFVLAAAMVSPLVFAPSVRAADSESEYESFNPENFDNSTTIDNKWFPLKPGMRRVWDGFCVDDEGEVETQSAVLVVTDLTKVIGGVRTVVCWERDIADRELDETELYFAAQDNDGTVWLLGEYPEEYDDGKLDAAPCWIHGIEAAKAGIIMPADPKIGSPSYSQGWAPAVEFTDRGAVYQMGQKTTVPFGSYDDVVVIEEFNKEEPGAVPAEVLRSRRGECSRRLARRGNRSGDVWSWSESKN